MSKKKNVSRKNTPNKIASVKKSESDRPVGQMSEMSDRLDLAKKELPVKLASAKEKTGKLLSGIAGKLAGLGSKIKESLKGMKLDTKEGGFKRVVENNKTTLIVAAAIILIGGAAYTFSYQSLPKLRDTHEENSGQSYKTYDAEVHPMQILSTVRENMVEFKGDPTSKGDGKTAESKYVIYSLDWFGSKRKTVLYYDETNTFNRIKLEIGNESAESLYEKLLKELGSPIEEEDPTVREGWAIWIKDAVKYKMMHRGDYTQLEMSIAKYENTQNLEIGKYPATIQYISTVDLNGDKEIDEKILLLGTRNSSTHINFDKLYLLVWDGKKTHLMEMNPENDGGAYPQVSFYDYDKDGKEDIVVSAENNVVDNYNIFSYGEEGLKLIYSGYEEPGLNEQEHDE